jgi:hypothetical protein
MVQTVMQSKNVLRQPPRLGLTPDLTEKPPVWTAALSLEFVADFPQELLAPLDVDVASDAFGLEAVGEVADAGALAGDGRPA